MGPFPMDRRFQPPVGVEYTSRGRRVVKVFRSAVDAKRFYVRMHKAGRGPKVVKPAAPPRQPEMF